MTQQNGKMVPWEDVPLKYGEDGPDYGRLYYQYSHLACPGTGEEIDNCAAPWDCASKGRCRMIYERARTHALKGRQT